jgi:hypothetical protein
MYKPLPATMPFHTRLVSELTRLDERESAAERKRGISNIYRLGIYLGAAQECSDEIDAGTPPSVAFTNHFTPTRSNHTIARRLNLGLDVQRGRWVNA